MDKARVKSATRGRKAGAGGDIRATSLTTVGGEARSVTLAGQTYELRPLTLNDALLLARRPGGLEGCLANIAGGEGDAFVVTAEMLEGIRFFAWLMLRKADPDLTEDAVGELLPLDETELFTTLAACLEASGLVKKGAQPETDPETPEASTGS